MRNLTILLLLASAATAQSPSPQLSISGNGSAEVNLMRGWPLVVKVVVLHSQRFQLAPKPADLVLQPAAGAWYDAVSFSQNWPLKLAQTPDTSVLVLPSRSMYEAIWQLSGDGTASLPSGKYSLTAHLELPAGSGWRGAVDSVPITVNIVDEPADLTADQQAEKVLLTARFTINQGDFNTAGRMVDALLVDQPSNPRALALRAMLFEQAGDAAAAAMSAAAAADVTANAPSAPADPAVQRAIQEESLFQNLRARLWSAYLATFQ